MAPWSPNKPTKDMITNLEQLYYNQIRDLYSAEAQLLGMLPQMAAHATCRELRDAFKDRLQETHTHCARRRGIEHQRSRAVLLLQHCREGPPRTRPGGVRERRGATTVADVQKCCRGGLRPPCCCPMFGVSMWASFAVRMLRCKESPAGGVRWGLVFRLSA